MNEKLPILRKKSMSLPLNPGVYLMKNKKGEIIYVGKAKALKNRVSSYFGSQNNHTVKVRKMVDNVDDFDYILCDSEFEALVLECSLIKQHSPKYNILLKDDKGYNYIKVINGEWRNFSAVKQKLNDGAEYIGPYTGSYGITNAVAEAKKLFLIPQCSKQFPRDYKKSRPCLNFYIGQCAAPCAGKITRQEHNEAVAAALDFIMNGSGGAIDRLTEQMLKASDELEFEKAAKLRDRINALKKVTEKQKVVAASVEEQDVFAVVGAPHGGSPKACLSVLRFKDGRLYDSEHFIIDLPEDMPEARHELIRSYYSMRDFVPRRIAVDGEVEGGEVLGEWLSSLAGRKVNIVVPQKGEQHSVVEMCRSNAAQYLTPLTGTAGRKTAALDELAGMLGLPAAPEFIESYDISHTAGSDNVAGMVVFQNGVPYKKAYKHFSIKGFTGQDDYASMAEVLDRRFAEYFKNKDSGEGFGRLPDLILLDGGKNHVLVIQALMREMGINIPVLGMVKDEHHKTRALVSEYGEVSIAAEQAVFMLIYKIQEEVHRFTVSSMTRAKRKKEKTSVLEKIDGIGAAKAKTLLSHFGGLAGVKKASAEELAAVKGITPETAERIITYFDKGERNKK